MADIKNLEFKKISQLPATEDDSNAFAVVSHEEGGVNTAKKYPLPRKANQEQVNSIDQRLSVVEDRSEHDKGYFTTEEGLFAEVPSPNPGDFANVAGIQYACEVKGIWINTGNPAPIPELDLNGYTLNGGSFKTGQQLDNEKANSIEVAFSIGKKIPLLNIGNIKNGVTSSVGSVKYSDYIDINVNTPIILNYLAVSQTSPVNYFDKNKTFISAINDAGGITKTILLNSHPTNAKYVIVSGIEAYIGYENGINMINNFNSRNIADDSDFVFMDTANKRYIYTNNGNVSAVVKPNTWTKNKIEITASARYQLLQTNIPFEIGKSYSFGVFIRVLSGTYNGRMIFIGGGYTYFTPKVLPLTDGWKFYYHEDYMPTVTSGDVYFIDANYGTTTNQIVEVAHPMVIIGNKISPVTYNNLNYFYDKILAASNRINKWSGKEWISYGDSIIATGNGTQSSPFSVSSGASFQVLVSAIIGFSKHYGRGIGGQSFVWNENTWFANADGSYNSRPPTTQPAGTTIHKGAFCSWDRITTMIPQNFNGIIFAMGGTNDLDNTIGGDPFFSNTNTLDTDWVSSDKYIGGDYDITTINGGIASMIMKMQIWCPKAIIIMGTPLSGRRNASDQYNVAKSTVTGNSTLDIANAVIETARFMSLPFIDVFAKTGINQINATDYITDGIHPYSQNGREAIARVIVAGIEDVQPKIF